MKLLDYYKLSDEMNVDKFQAFRAYQHFLYYINVSHLQAYAPWGEHLTNHFIEKLRAGISRTGAGFARIDAVVNWVQDMNEYHQQALMGYIMRHHKLGWQSSFNRLDPDRIELLPSVGAGIDPEGFIYPQIENDPPEFDETRGMHIRDAELTDNLKFKSMYPDFYHKMSSEDYAICKAIAEWNEFEILELDK